MRISLGGDLRLLPPFYFYIVLFLATRHYSNRSVKDIRPRPTSKREDWREVEDVDSDYLVVELERVGR